MMRLMRDKRAVLALLAVVAVLWTGVAMAAEEPQVAPLLPYVTQIVDFGNGRYMARLGVPPFYTYLQDATAEINALTQADKLRQVQSHASYLRPFYIVTNHLVSGGQCSQWKRCEVTLWGIWGPVMASFLSGSDPAAGDAAFATVKTGSGIQHLRRAAVAGVQPLASWGGHGNCRVTWRTGASMTFHCSAAEMIKALGK